MKEFIGIRVDPGLIAQIDEEAAKEERSRSDMIRVIFSRYLRDRSSSQSAVQAGKTQIDPSFFQGGRV